MPKGNLNYRKGRLAEIKVLSMLEEFYLSSTDMTGNDFGIDVTVQMPFPSPGQIDSDCMESWEMTSNFCHIQIKNVEKLSLKREHLEMWDAANCVRPNTNFLIQIVDGGLVLIRPEDIRYLYEKIVKNGRKSISTGVNYFGNSHAKPPRIGKYFDEQSDGLKLANYLWDKAGTPQQVGDYGESKLRQIIIQERRKLDEDEIYSEINYLFMLMFPGIGIPEAYLEGSEFITKFSEFLEWLLPFASDEAKKYFEETEDDNLEKRGRISESNGSGFFIFRYEDISSYGLSRDIIQRSSGSIDAYKNLIYSLQRYISLL